MQCGHWRGAFQTGGFSEIQFQLRLERAINPADADNRRQQKAIQPRVVRAGRQAGSAAAILLRGIRFPSLGSRTHPRRPQISPAAKRVMDPNICAR